VPDGVGQRLGNDEVGGRLQRLRESLVGDLQRLLARVRARGTDLVAF
jgi:hypothetical protein